MTAVDIALFGATHRCGSTLLQRVFNANPDTMIWGENGRALRHFATIHQGTRYFSEYTAQFRDEYFQSGRTSQEQMLANLCPDLEFVETAIEDGIRGYFEALYAGHRDRFTRLGFKEVRHGRREIELFRRVYPDAEIVLLARNPIDTWHSLPIRWGAHRTVEDFLKTWTEHLDYYKHLSAEEARAHFFWYEMFLKDPDTQAQIRDLAGITEAQFGDVVQVKVGSTRSQEEKPSEDEAVIREQCAGYLAELSPYL